MSLRYKILAAVVGITVPLLVVVLVVIVIELIGAKKDFESVDENLRKNLVTWVEKNAESVYNDPAVSQMPLVLDLIHVKGQDANGGMTFLKGGKTLSEARIRAAVRRAIRKARRGERNTIEGSTFVVLDRPSTSGGTPEGGLYVRLDIPNFRPHEPLQKLYVVMLFGLVIVVLVIYVVLSRTVIRPIEHLERAAKRVAGGDYSRPVPLSGRQDEMDTLIVTFNRMMMELGHYRDHLNERAEEARKQARAAEKNLVIAQRLAATGKLASGIAHEVNNPLAGMQNAARRLLRDPPAERTKQKEYLELIIDGLERVKETVKKILQFTPHQVAPQAVSVETFLNRALALAGHRIEEEGTEVVVDLPADTLVFGDPFELQQVFLNVLLNALDAISATGQKGEIRIRGTVEDSEIRLEVTDNGCGMVDEQVSQAFDLFYTTKGVGEGTGLGLSIAHNVIQNHGGRIEIHSASGRGTTVEICLPLIEEGGTPLDFGTARGYG